MHHKRPLVTVLVPSFNHSKYISRSIESIFNQTYKNFNLIVIDDGSTDGSIEILESLKSTYNFKLVRQENKGISFTLNRCIREYTDGEYFTFCASDDFWLPRKLELQVNFLEMNRFYPMCYGRAMYVSETSEILDNGLSETLHGGYIFEDILLFKIHPPVNYMFRTHIFDEIGLYDEYLLAEDYDMNLRIAHKYPIGFIDETLFCYRTSNEILKIIRFDSISNSHLKSIDKFKDHLLFKNARLMVFLRKFDNFSSYSTLKAKAVSNLLRCLPYFHKSRFIKAFIKLIIKWH